VPGSERERTDEGWVLSMCSTRSALSARLLWVLLGLGGCTGYDVGVSEVAEDIGPRHDSQAPLPTGMTGDTAATVTPPDEPDCSAELTNFPAVWAPNEGYGPFFYTGVDFDFDIFGRLVTSVGHQLVAFDSEGNANVINQILGDSPLGIRSTPTGDLLMAMPELGSVRRLNADTGDLQTVMGGMSYPYALEVAMDGTVYVSDYGEDGHIYELDVESGEAIVIAEASNVIALALSSDEQTLYMSSTTTQFSDAGRITAIDRDSDGVWDPEIRLVYGNGYRVDAITSDACGYLYVGGWNGRLVRIRQEDDFVEQLVDLPTWGLYAARFGPDLGGFGRTQLHLTDGSQLFTVELGLDGRHVLAP
jgi:hypothetical protein